MENNEDIELIESFVSECYDMMDEVEPVFIMLQSKEDSETPLDLDNVNSIFRLFHSMKGSASFLALNNIAEVTHKAETLLDIFRRESLLMTSYYVEVQLKTVDAIREMLAQVREHYNDQGFEDLRSNIVSCLDEAIAAASGTGPMPDDEAQDDHNEEEPEVEMTAQEDLGTEEEESMEEPSTEEEESMEEPEEVQKKDIPEFTISNEMAQRFSQESSEVLDSAEQSLLRLEKVYSEKEKTDLISEAFRHIHSFKGNCGFMQLPDLETLSHRLETLLDAVRNKDAEFSEQNVDIMLEVVDTLRQGLKSFADGKSGKIDNCAVMVEFLEDLIPKPMEIPSKPKEEKEEPQTPKEKAPTKKKATKKATPKAVAQKSETKTVADENKKEEADDKSVSEKKVQTSEPVDSSKLAESKREVGDKLVTDDADKKELPRPTASAGGAVQQTRRDIRVDVDKLDKLIDLVGELVIAEAMVLRSPALLGIEDEALDRSIHHLRRISSDLQDVAMSVRMIPLSGTFRRMIRLVHDLSRKSGKKANLELVGEETEVDKNVIEQIGDPLVHIIRNSCDHGIEPPDERIAAGKVETGTITLEARHEGGEVWIIIHDDGRGLNREKILAKAIERGLLTSDGSELSDEEVFGFIFHPGFSTAAQVTDISGRGVGMDVVKKNIEKLSGRVRVKSELGVGTDIILHIPLTLAIIDGMLVRVGNTQFTIPLLSIRESIPKPSKDIVTVTPDGQENILVRGELIPVLRIHKIFNKKGAITELSQGILVIVESDSDNVALMVDELLGQQETVIKGLSSYLGRAKGISGCTVLGTGEVSLILDVGSLVKSEEIK